MTTIVTLFLLDFIANVPYLFWLAIIYIVGEVKGILVYSLVYSLLQYINVNKAPVQMNPHPLCIQVLIC